MADIVRDKEDLAKVVEEGLVQVVIDVIEDKMNVEVVDKVTCVSSRGYTFLCVVCWTAPNLSLGLFFLNSFAFCFFY